MCERLEMKFDVKIGGSRFFCGSFFFLFDFGF